MRLTCWSPDEVTNGSFRGRRISRRVIDRKWIIVSRGVGRCRVNQWNVAVRQCRKADGALLSQTDKSHHPTRLALFRSKGEEIFGFSVRASRRDFDGFTTYAAP